MRVKKGDLIKCQYSNRFGERHGMYLARVLDYKTKRDTPIYLEAIICYSDGLKIDGNHPYRHFQVKDTDVLKNFGAFSISNFEVFEDEYPEYAL